MVALGVDAGSSSVKCALVDIPTGRILAVARYPEQEMEIHSPYPSWAEQNPEDWWDFTCKAISMVCDLVNILPETISCIGIGYQMHGLVLVDKAGQPVRPSIIWCDSRAVASGNALADALSLGILEENLLNHPGNFTAAKLKWVKENEPENYKRIHKVLLPGDYLAYKMTGAYTTTWSGLSEGIWFDFKRQDVSLDMMASGDFDESMIPHAGSCFEALCTTHEVFYQLTGIMPGTPVSYRAGDQPTNAYSLGVLRPGQAAATCGTSGVVYVVSDAPHGNIQAGFNTFLHVNHAPRKMRFGNLLCINGAGIMYAWLRNQAFQGLSYDDMEAEAAVCNPGSDGLLCLPFGNGAERMLLNQNTGASFLGLDVNRHTRGHMARAALEGIAFAFVYGMERMAAAGVPVHSLKTGHDNMFRSSVFSATLSDISGIPIDIYETTGAAGAAMGAAYGAGFAPKMEKVEEVIVAIHHFEPKTAAHALVQNYARWKQALISIIGLYE